MANIDKNIEQVFKDGFNDFEHDVSGKVWQNLDAILFEDKVVTKSNSSILKSMLIVSIPLSIIIGAGALYPDAEVNSYEVADSSHVEQSVEIENTSNEKGLLAENQVGENESEDNNDFLEPQVLIMEDQAGDDIEEVIVEMKGNTQVEEKNNDSAKKEMPQLSDKPYINYNFYKKQSSETYSKFSIAKLKSGILLVRLKTREKGIDALLKNGQKRKAEKYRKEVYEDNLSVINAFKKNYNFSDVYFFYSSNSEDVRNKNFKGVFLNENLEKDENIVLDPSKTFYMILDIGAVKIPGDDETRHYANAISRALVVKDRDFEQLYRPFPFYVGASNKKNINQQVDKLNDGLKFFYDSNQEKF